MRSNKFLETAKRIAREDKAFFDTLLEFEKTKKMRTKVRLNFTIDKALASKFRKLCRDKGYNMSAKIGQVINEILKKES